MELQAGRIVSLQKWMAPQMHVIHVAAMNNMHRAVRHTGDMCLKN
jgi:hypothetical protein